MKKLIFAIMVLGAMTMTSCDKDKGFEKMCALEECDICDDHRFGPHRPHGPHGPHIPCGDSTRNDSLKGGMCGNGMMPPSIPELEEIIIEPLETESSCGYIVRGKVKYLINGKLAAIVDYGDGEIDAWVVKTIYMHKKHHPHHQDFDHDHDHDHDYNYKGDDDDDYHAGFAEGGCYEKEHDKKGKRKKRKKYMEPKCCKFEQPCQNDSSIDTQVDVPTVFGNEVNY